jgi:3-dehydroquinate synthase
MRLLHELQVEVAGGSYPIIIGHGFEQSVDQLLQKRGWNVSTPTMIVTDEHVAALPWFQQFHTTLQNVCTKLIKAVVPAGEQAKSLHHAEALYDQAFEAGLDRDAWILAVGGGVVGDLAGFVAATYMRGVSFVQVPTTLLAHDSSIGGKVAVNHPRGKNIIGAFHQPRMVLFDVKSLLTLPDREYQSGLAEAVKHALIADADLWEWIKANRTQIQGRDLEILSELLMRSCSIKARIVQQDEREQSVRALLNFGHTFGHAFETLAGYGVLTHGEAVSIGMIAALELGSELGYHANDVRTHVEEVLVSLHLPIRLKVSLSIEACIDRMLHDKKVKSDKLTFVLLESIGKAILVRDVPLAPIQNALQLVLEGE